MQERLRMEIYYWSQSRASLKDMHDNCSFCLIAISIYRAALQIRLDLDLRLKHLVYCYGIWHSAAYMAIAPITAHFYQFFVFGALFFSQIPVRSKSDTDKEAE